MDQLQQFLATNGRPLRIGLVNTGGTLLCLPTGKGDDGEDLLDPAAGLKVKILEDGGVEFKTRFFGDEVEEVVTTPEQDENNPVAFNEKIEIGKKIKYLL